MAKQKPPNPPPTEKCFTIVKDTREQLGWDFVKRLPCLGTVVKTLKTGDYSIEGLEDQFTVERKRNTAELAQNFATDWGRIQRELERLESFAFPFLVCEFTLEDVLKFPVGSGIPQSRWRRLRTRPDFLLKRLCEIELNYKTRVVFAGNSGQQFVRSLCKRVFEKING